MQIGDQVEGGIYAGKINGHHIICLTFEYDLPFRINWQQATEYCKSISVELPTKDELILLYELYKLNPEYFPKRKYQWYWSSTESSPTYAWIQGFFTGNQYTDGKTDNYYVCAVRRVKI